MMDSYMPHCKFQRLLHFAQSRNYTSQMKNRNVDVEAPYQIPRTKDVLGEHLHNKVQELMNGCFKGSETLSSDKRYKPADKITGMLLERSESEIRMMLQDDHYLMQNVELALKAWRKECADYISSMSAAEEEEDKPRLSYDEVGEALFEKVSAYEKKWTSEITGMLLELDARTLLELLKGDDVLLCDAIEKARSALLASKLKLYQEARASSDVRSEQGSKRQESSSAGAEGVSSKKGKDGPEADIPVTEDALREQIGSMIYDIVAEQHPECPAIITGMILELDIPTLQEVVEDTKCLKAAIDKAYEVWDANT